MIKVFKKESVNFDYDEIRVFDMDSGEFKHYYVDKKIGFPFSMYKTNVLEMGYKSVNECLKTLKERKSIGYEIDPKEQKESERLGFIKLGIERIKRAGRINTSDFEDVCNDLAKYGMGFYDAQNCITAAYLHNREVVTC